RVPRSMPVRRAGGRYLSLRHVLRKLRAPAHRDAALRPPLGRAQCVALRDLSGAVRSRLPIRDSDSGEDAALPPAAHARVGPAGAGGNTRAGEALARVPLDTLHSRMGHGIPQARQAIGEPLVALMQQTVAALHLDL